MLGVRHGWMTVVMASSLLGFSATAVAEEGDEGEDHAGCYERRQYDACFREGKRQYAADAYDEAYRAYLEGWKLQPNYEVAGNLGNVELKLGKHADAYAHLKYSLERLPPSQRSTEIVGRIEGKLEEALVHVGARKLEIEPEDARLTIDGEPVELDEDLWIALVPGEHRLTVEREGYDAVEKTLDVRAGEEKSLEIVLAKTAVEESPAPRAVVSEGDEGVSPTKLGLGITGIALGTGGVVAAIILGITSADRAETVDELGATALQNDPSGNACGPGSPVLGGNLCAQLEDFHREEVVFRNAAIASGVVGAVVLAGSIIYLALPSDESDAELAVKAGPSNIGVTLTGRF